MAFTEGLDNNHSAIFLYNLEGKKATQVTSGFYEDSGPVSSTDGKYLFYLSDRGMSAAYSAMGDGTWIYPNSTKIVAMALSSKTSPLLSPKNDALKTEEDKEEEKEEGKEEKKKGKEKKGEDKEEPKSEEVEVLIELNEMESRLEVLPPKAGNIG